MSNKISGEPKVGSLLDGSEFELKFGMELVFRDELKDGSLNEINAYRSWRDRFSGKTVYLVGWCDEAFAVADEKGDYNFEFIGGHPSFLFKLPNTTGETEETRS